MAVNESVCRQGYGGFGSRLLLDQLCLILSLKNLLLNFCFTSSRLLLLKMLVLRSFHIYERNIRPSNISSQTPAAECVFASFMHLAISPLCSAPSQVLQCCIMLWFPYGKHNKSVSFEALAIFCTIVKSSCSQQIFPYLRLKCISVFFAHITCTIPFSALVLQALLNAVIMLLG